MATSLSPTERIQEQINRWLTTTPQAERTRIIAKLQRHVNWADQHNGGVPVSFLTLPYLIPQSLLNQAQTGTEALLEALIRMEEVAFANQNGPLWQRLWEAAGPEGQKHLQLPYYEQPASIRQRFRRADAIVDAKTGQPRFLEMNQVGPQGMTRFDDVHAFSAALLNQIGVTVTAPASICRGILQWLITEHQQHQRTKEVPACIAVVVEHSYAAIMSAIPAAAHRMQHYADEQYGVGAIKIVICHQANFELRGNDMWVGAQDSSWQKVDIVWRNAARLDRHPTISRPNIDGWHAIVQHPEQFLIVNGEVGPRLTRTKGALAALWNDDCLDEIGLTTQQRELVHQYLPETHHLQRDRWAWPKILSHPAGWVLKPSDGGLGEGIKFGANFESDKQLQIFMESDEATNYVAQRYVPTKPLQLNHLQPSDGVVTQVDIDVDLCPYIVGGIVSNQLYSRGSLVDGSGILKTHNVAQGGLVVPVFAV